MYTAWKFTTARFTVRLLIEEVAGYQYDGDDEGGETQAKLDSGEYVAFDSRVVVELDGREVGSDSLSGSVYAADSVSEFWTAHRDLDPMNRNTSERGEPDSVICHYFPDMVRAAIEDARSMLKNAPPLRDKGVTAEEMKASDNLAAILSIVGPYGFGIEGGGAMSPFLARHTSGRAMVAIGAEAAPLDRADPCAPIWEIQCQTEEGECFNHIHNTLAPLPLLHAVRLASDIADALPHTVMDRAELVGRIAGLFSDLLRTGLGEETFETIRQRNRTATEGVCHSHDFCDANEVMADAMHRMGIETFPEYRVTWNWAERFPDRGGMPESVVDLWNEAWEAARVAFLIAPDDRACAMLRAAGFESDHQDMRVYRPNGWHIVAADVDGSGDPTEAAFALGVYGPDDDCEEDARLVIRSGEGLTFADALNACLAFVDGDQQTRREVLCRQYDAWREVEGIFKRNPPALLSVDELRGDMRNTAEQDGWLEDASKRWDRNEEE